MAPGPSLASSGGSEFMSAHSIDLLSAQVRLVRRPALRGPCAHICNAQRSACARARLNLLRALLCVAGPRCVCVSVCVHACVGKRVSFCFVLKSVVL